MKEYDVIRGSTSIPPMNDDSLKRLNIEDWNKTVPSDVIEAVNIIGEHASPPNRIDYKYREDDIIADFLNYIDKTYGQHYKTEGGKIECFDVWLAMGDATPTFRNTAIKYLWRYGKKNTYVEFKADLFKAMHYVLMCLYNDFYSKTK